MEKDSKLFEYLTVLFKHKKLIGTITGGACILSVIISLLLPKVYTAKVSILPPHNSPLQDMGFSLMSPGPSIGSGSGIGGLLGAGSPADLWVGILKSRTVKDSIIERFNLVKIYDAKTLDETREVLNERVQVSKQKKEEIIVVAVDDEDPEKAAAMANAFVEELDRVNKNVVMTSGKKARIFIEKRLDEATSLLSKTEEDIRSFQERNKVFKLEEQSKAMIEAIGAVKGQLIAKEVALQTLLSYASASNPEVKLLKTEIAELKSKLKELDEGGAEHGKDIFIPSAKIPSISLKYVRFLRDAKFEETLFQLLTQQYEMARIQEAKDSPTVQVLDVAVPPQEKSRPKRAFIVLASTFTAGLLAVFLAFVSERLQAENTDGSIARRLFTKRQR